MPKPIYIRPSKDTLYIPYPEQLDTMAMAKMEENQCLKYVGIIASAFDSLTMGAHMVYDTSALPLLSGLKNLETMYIIDGYAKGMEDWQDRSGPQKCRFELKDVEVGQAGMSLLSRYNLPATIHNLLKIGNFWEVWSSAHIDLIRKCFTCEEERIRLLQMKWDGAEDGAEWKLPEIVGKRLVRELIEPVSYC